MLEVVQRFAVPDFERAAMADGGDPVPAIVGEAASTDRNPAALDHGEAVAARFGKAAVNEGGRTAADGRYGIALGAGGK